MIWFFIGNLGMFFIELMAMKVEGLSKYFREGWNYMDTFAFIFSNTFIAVKIMIDLQD